MRDAGGYRGRGLLKTIDWSLVICWITLILIGWANIYASIQASEPASIFDFSCRSGKQFVWILTAIGIANFAAEPIYEAILRAFGPFFIESSFVSSNMLY